MATSNITWDNQNLLGFIDERWTYKNAYLNSQGILQIEPNGYISITISDNVNFAFRYAKLNVTFYGLSLDETNNFKSEPNIFIQEVYKNNSDNAISRGITRVVGFNMYKKVSEDPPKYMDETTFEMGNLPMFSYTLKISNTSENNLLIYGVELFSSVDVSEGQINKTVTSISKSTAAERIVVGVDPNDSTELVSFGVYLQNAANLVQFYPIYYNGNIIGLDTNYGQSIAVDFFTDDGSHTVPDGTPPDNSEDSAGEEIT